MAGEQLGLNFGVHAVTTGTQLFVSIANAVILKLGGLNSPLGEYFNKGGSIGQIDVPTDAISKIAARLNEENIVFQFGNAENFGERNLTTIQFKDNVYQKDAFGEFVLDENGEKVILVKGDRDKIQEIISDTIERYKEAQPPTIDEANKEFKNCNMIEMRFQSFTDAKVYQDIANEMQIKSIMTLSEETNMFSVAIPAELAISTDLSEKSEFDKLKERYILFRSHPSVADYFNERSESREMLQQAIYKASNGERYEQLAIYNVGTTTQSENFKNAIIFTGNSIVNHRYFELDEKGEPILDKMAVKSYNLKDAAQYDEFVKLMENLGDYKAISGREYSCMGMRYDLYRKLTEIAIEKECGILELESEDYKELLDKAREEESGYLNLDKNDEMLIAKYANIKTFVEAVEYQDFKSFALREQYFNECVGAMEEAFELERNDMVRIDEPDIDDIDPEKTSNRSCEIRIPGTVDVIQRTFDLKEKDETEIWMKNIQNEQSKAETYYKLAEPTMFNIVPNAIKDTRIDIAAIQVAVQQKKNDIEINKTKVEDRDVFDAPRTSIVPEGADPIIARTEAGAELEEEHDRQFEEEFEAARGISEITDITIESIEDAMDDFIENDRGFDFSDSDLV